MFPSQSKKVLRILKPHRLLLHKACQGTDYIQLANHLVYLLTSVFFFERSSKNKQRNMITFRTIKSIFFCGIYMSMVGSNHYNSVFVPILLFCFFNKVKQHRIGIKCSTTISISFG